MMMQRIADAGDAAEDRREGPLREAAARIGTIVQRLQPTRTAGLDDYRDDPAAALGKRLGWHSAISYRGQFRPSRFGNKDGFSAGKAKLLAAHLEAIVAGRGGTLTLPARSWPQDWTDEARDKLRTWLDDALDRFEQAMDRFVEADGEGGTPGSTPLLRNPAWRHIDRPALVETMLGMLAQRGRACIVGASGTRQDGLVRNQPARSGWEILRGPFR